MQNSPDPEEEEEVLEEDDGEETSSQADSVLLQEIQALTQTLNNNWAYNGEITWSGLKVSLELWLKYNFPAFLDQNSHIQVRTIWSPFRI